MEIDGKAKTITITSAEKASRVSLRKMLPFVKAGMPIIALQAGMGNTLFVYLIRVVPVFSL